MICSWVVPGWSQFGVFFGTKHCLRKNYWDSGCYWPCHGWVLHRYLFSLSFKFMAFVFINCCWFVFEAPSLCCVLSWFSVTLNEKMKIPCSLSNRNTAKTKKICGMLNNIRQMSFFFFILIISSLFHINLSAPSSLLLICLRLFRGMPGIIWLLKQPRKAAT